MTICLFAILSFGSGRNPRRCEAAVYDQHVVVDDNTNTTVGFVVNYAAQQTVVVLTRSHCVAAPKQDLIMCGFMSAFWRDK